MTRPLSAGGTRSGGPGGLCAQLGSPALPARSPGAGRAQPRRGATSPPGPPRAPSLCAHGRTNLTALRHAAERTFNVVGFFSSRFCLVGVPADFCLFFLSFFFFRFSVVVAFSSVFSGALRNLAPTRRCSCRARRRNRYAGSQGGFPGWENEVAETLGPE